MNASDEAFQFGDPVAYLRMLCSSGILAKSWGCETLRHAAGTTSIPYLTVYHIIFDIVNLVIPLLRYSPRFTGLRSSAKIATVYSLLERGSIGISNLTPIKETSAKTGEISGQNPNNPDTGNRTLKNSIWCLH